MSTHIRRLYPACDQPRFSPRGIERKMDLLEFVIVRFVVSESITRNTGEVPDNCGESRHKSWTQIQPSKIGCCCSS